MCPTNSCRLPPVLGGRLAPFPLPFYLVGCPFPGGNRFESFRVSVWGRCKGGVPTPTSVGARSPEVIISRRFAVRVARLLLSVYRFLAFPPWEPWVARFLPLAPAGFFLAGFLSLPLLLLLLLPLVARLFPFLAKPFFFAAFWLLLLPLLLLLLLLLPLVLLCRRVAATTVVTVAVAIAFAIAAVVWSIDHAQYPQIHENKFKSFIVAAAAAGGAARCCTTAGRAMPAPRSPVKERGG